MSSNSNDPSSFKPESTYIETNNPQSIHLLYDPLTFEELQDNKTNKQHKENNTQMMNYIISHIQYPKSQLEAKGNIIKSFEEYFFCFIKQIIVNPLPQIIITDNDIKLDKRCIMNNRSIDLISMNISNNVFKPCYSYRFDKKTLVISIKKTSINKIIVKGGKIVKDQNVITLIAYFPKEANQPLNEVYVNCLSFDNLYHNQYEFEIPIPTSACIINNFKLLPNNRKNKNEGIIELTYSMLSYPLKVEEEEDQSFN